MKSERMQQDMLFLRTRRGRPPTKSATNPEATTVNGKLNARMKVKSLRTKHELMKHCTRQSVIQNNTQSRQRCAQLLPGPPSCVRAVTRSIARLHSDSRTSSEHSRDILSSTCIRQNVKPTVDCSDIKEVPESHVQSFGPDKQVAAQCSTSIEEDTVQPKSNLTFLFQNKKYNFMCHMITPSSSTTELPESAISELRDTGQPKESNNQPTDQSDQSKYILLVFSSRILHFLFSRHTFCRE